MIRHKIPGYSTRALSPIFATLILATIVITLGSVAYYYASNITKTATNEYVSSISDSQQSISERLGFENVVYTPPNLLVSPQVPGTLKVYLINCGVSYNLKITYLFLYDSSHNLLGYFSASPFSPINAGDPPITNGLNIGKDGYFTAILKTQTETLISLTHGAMYTIHLLTEKGSAFDYECSPS